MSSLLIQAGPEILSLSCRCRVKVILLHVRGDRRCKIFRSHSSITNLECLRHRWVIVLAEVGRLADIECAFKVTGPVSKLDHQDAHLFTRFSSEHHISLSNVCLIKPVGHDRSVLASEARDMLV